MRKAILILIILGCVGWVSGQDSTKNVSSKSSNVNLVTPSMLPPPPADGTIEGPTHVTYGQTYNYSFQYLYPNVTWVASNGLVLNSTYTTAEVVWSGSIGMAFDDDKGAHNSYALGGPNIKAPAYKIQTQNQTLSGTLSVYSNGTLEASIDVTTMSFT